MLIAVPPSEKIWMRQYGSCLTRDNVVTSNYATLGVVLAGPPINEADSEGRA